MYRGYCQNSNVQPCSIIILLSYSFCWNTARQGRIAASLSPSLLFFICISNNSMIIWVLMDWDCSVTGKLSSYFCVSSCLYCDMSHDDIAHQTFFTEIMEGKLLTLLAKWQKHADTTTTTTRKRRKYSESETTPSRWFSEIFILDLCRAALSPAFERPQGKSPGRASQLHTLCMLFKAPCSPLPLLCCPC